MSKFMSNERLEREVERVFSEDPLYIEFQRQIKGQLEKGLLTYGQPVSKADVPFGERINHMQSEMIDAWIYGEWAKGEYDRLEKENERMKRKLSDVIKIIADHNCQPRGTVCYLCKEISTVLFGGGEDSIRRDGGREES